MTAAAPLWAMSPHRMLERYDLLLIEVANFLGTGGMGIVWPHNTLVQKHVKRWCYRGCYR